MSFKLSQAVASRPSSSNSLMSTRHLASELPACTEIKTTETSDIKFGMSCTKGKKSELFAKSCWVARANVTLATPRS